jgi:hypothetical protein
MRMTNRDDIEMAKNLRKQLLPVVIRNLVADGRLDVNKLDDREYVDKVLAQNENILDELTAIVEVHGDFLISAKEAINANRPEVAVVLIATAIEQIVNTFYREVLAEKGYLTADEITEIIRTTNMNAKLGWLLAIVADFSLDILPEHRLQKDILSLMELRNQIVHYKAVPKSLWSETPIPQRIQDYGFDKMLEIPEQLLGSLDAALNNVRAKQPDYLSILKAVEKLI